MRLKDILDTISDAQIAGASEVLGIPVESIKSRIIPFLKSNTLLSGSGCRLWIGTRNSGKCNPDRDPIVWKKDFNGKNNIHPRKIFIALCNGEDPTGRGAAYMCKHGNQMCVDPSHAIRSRRPKESI